MNHKWTYFAAGILVGAIIGSWVFFAVASSHYGMRGGMFRDSNRMMGRGDSAGRSYQRDDLKNPGTPTAPGNTAQKPETKLPATGTGSIPPGAK